jgi:putative transposase
MSRITINKGIVAGLVGDLIMQAVEKRFGFNGSCYTAAEARSFAKEMWLKPVKIPITTPQSNGMTESFVKTLKRDYGKLANRQDLKNVMAQLKDWFDDYN